MDETDKFKENLSRKSCSFSRNILNNLFNPIIGFINTLKKSVITSRKNPETFISNISLKDDQTLDDTLKTMKKIHCKSKRYFDTDNEEIRFRNHSASEYDISVKASRLRIGNLNAACGDNAHANAGKLILDTVSGANICRSNQIPGSFRLHISTEKSEDNNQSKNNDESEPSTSTIQCMDIGSKTSENETSDNASADYNSGTSNTSANFLYNYSNKTSSKKISGNGPEITSTVITKTFSGARNYSDNDSTCKNSKSSLNLAKYFYVNVFIASMNSSGVSPEDPTDALSASSRVANISDDQDCTNQSILKVSNDQKTTSDDNLSVLNPNPCKALQFSDSNSDSSHSVLNFSDDNKGSSHSNLKHSDDDMGSSHSNLKHSDDDMGSSHSNLKHFDDDMGSSASNVTFSDSAQEFGDDTSSHPLKGEFYAALRKFREKCDSIYEIPFMFGNERMPDLKAELQNFMKEFNEKLATFDSNSASVEHEKISVGSTETTFDSNSASVEHEKISIGSTETMEIVSEAILDVFKTVVKCYPIKKFEIPPYEYAIAERTKRTTEGKRDDSRENHLSTCNDHQKTLEGCFSNIDSHSVMAFDIEDCFSENSRIICDSLINEYLDCAIKEKILLIRRVNDVSVEDYESRISKILSLDDELGYLTAKLIVTINDWNKQFQELNHNLQNDAQSKNSSRNLHHMGILRICVLLARILLTLTFGKQLTLEEYEKDLILYHKRRN